METGSRTYQALWVQEADRFKRIAKPPCGSSESRGGFCQFTLQLGTDVSRCAEIPKRCYFANFAEHWRVNQCQLVKNFENRINSLNIGIKYHSEMNPGANGVDHAICRTVLLFDCMVKKQVCKMPAM